MSWSVSAFTGLWFCGESGDYCLWYWYLWVQVCLGFPSDSQCEKNRLKRKKAKLAKGRNCEKSFGRLRKFFTLCKNFTSNAKCFSTFAKYFWTSAKNFSPLAGFPPQKETQRSVLCRGTIARIFVLTRRVKMDVAVNGSDAFAYFLTAVALRCMTTHCSLVTL